MSLTLKLTRQCLLFTRHIKISAEHYDMYNAQIKRTCSASECFSPTHTAVARLRPSTRAGTMRSCSSRCARSLLRRCSACLHPLTTRCQ